MGSKYSSRVIFSYLTKNQYIILGFLWNKKNLGTISPFVAPNNQNCEKKSAISKKSESKECVEYWSDA